MLRIDGTHAEGGGQLLRSSLALSMVTGEPFRIERIRSTRKRPKILQQHLTAIRAAAAISGAAVSGDRLGGTALTFHPGSVGPGDHFRMETAGSVTLIVKTLLPPLLTADRPSRLVLEGGTHNPYAPPFEFLNRTFLPLVARMGPRVTASLDRPGF